LNISATKVWNIYTQVEDSDGIIKERHNADSKPARRIFYSWKEFQSLQSGHQITIIKVHNQFTAGSGRLFNLWILQVRIQQRHQVGRLIPNSTTYQYEKSMTALLPPNNSCMNKESVYDRFYHLTACTVTNFLQQRFLSGDSTPVV
jgi:hypothetical protein